MPGKQAKLMPTHKAAQKYSLQFHAGERSPSSTDGPEPDSQWSGVMGAGVKVPWRTTGSLAMP